MEPRIKSIIYLSIKCGVKFQGRLYAFDTATPIANNDLKEYVPSVKVLDGAECISDSISEESKLVYELGKTLALLGPEKRLEPSDLSALKLNALSKYYYKAGKLEDAHLFAEMARSLATDNHSVISLIYLTIMECKFTMSLESNPESANFKIIEDYYELAVKNLTYHWGPNHPLHMTLNDKVVQLLCKSKEISRAFDFHRKSLDMAFKILGKAHKVSASYLTKASR